MPYLQKTGLVILLVCLVISAKAQFNTKLPSFKLSTTPKTNSVIYVLDSIKFYFDKSSVVKLLKGKLKNPTDSVLYNLIENSKSDSIIKAGTSDGYLIDRLVTYLIFDAQTSIYTEKIHQFINKGYIYTYGWDMDIKGPYIIYSLYSPNGQVLYNKRVYNEEFDYLSEKF